MDVFHVILLIYFTLFIVYPKFMRVNFIYFINLVVIVAILNYLYVLLFPEIKQNDELSKIFYILGVEVKISPSLKYWKAGMLDDTWIIVLLAYLQYQLYKSKLLEGIYLEKTKSEERIIMNVKYPKASKIYIYLSECVRILIPWLIYTILISILVVLDKTIINFQFI